MAGDKKTIIIAEAGVNHNGDLGRAKEMAALAREAGADYVKFQTFIPKKLTASGAATADYQKKALGADVSQRKMLERLALPDGAFAELSGYCQRIGIGFLSTPFDLESIDILSPLDMDYWKIPSGEVTDLPYLEKIGKTGKPIILSTGMCDLGEVKAALSALEENGACEIAILHCNTDYPTPYGDVNLRAMKHMERVFHKKVGYSDHTPGIEVAVAAAALGACIIEKHFTLDRKLEGPDHQASLEPGELAGMVRAIRNVEAALGDGEKKRTASEERNLAAARKSIVASRDIMAGESLTESNVTTKRPGSGISPMEWHNVLGKKAKRNYKEDELLD